MIRQEHKKNRLGRFTVLYILKTCEDKRARNEFYNDVLFSELERITEKKMQVFALNEMMNGGVLYANKKWRDKALEKFEEELKGYDVKICKEVESAGGKYVKVGLQLTEKPKKNNWKKLNSL